MHPQALVAVRELVGRVLPPHTPPEPLLSLLLALNKVALDSGEGRGPGTHLFLQKHGWEWCAEPCPAVLLTKGQYWRSPLI
jgi:hypothetical protein